MRVLLSNNTGCDAMRLLRAYPETTGQLHNVDSFRKPKQVRWCLDNGVYARATAGLPADQYDASPVFDFLNRYINSNADWVAVPDWVGNRLQTLKFWDLYAAQFDQYNINKAFVVQDGMTVADVPQNADVVFVGGSTSFKWRTLPIWIEHFDRVHVGRVNTYRTLMMAKRAGAESVDGTGWFRAGPERLHELERFLFEQKHNIEPEQMEFKYAR